MTAHAAAATAVMVLAMMPVMAFAEEPQNTGNYFSVTKNGETTEYSTAVDAVASVSDGETATTTLLDNYSGGGVKVEGTGKNITFDLARYTWTIGTPLVGSTGTETNAFQLLQGNAVTFTNGVITSSVARILFQNYCELTLDGVDVSLLTPGTGNYAASNNNGRTVITGGTVISVTEGNYAMDSFTFGNYAGGNVFVESAVINGDVEVANGGRVQVDGGTVNGDMIVHNYAYDANVSKAPVLIVNSGLIEGNVETSELGNTEINGGMITGAVTVDPTGGASASVSGGIFGSIGENVAVTAADVANITDSGTTMTVVGLSNINGVLAYAGEGTSVEVVKASPGANIEAPAGVAVQNRTETAVSVNGEELLAGGQITVEDPSVNPGNPEENPPAQPGDKPQTTPPGGDGTKTDPSAAGKSPLTGDGTDVLMWALMAVAAAGAGCMAYRRRRA